VVAITQGLSQNAQVVAGSVGLLREGTVTRFSPTTAAVVSK
jgi:hypothetical protein